jgi:hypothetical protein
MAWRQVARGKPGRMIDAKQMSLTNSRGSGVRGLVSTPARVAVCVGAIGVLLIAIRLWFARGYNGPWVFDDELGYQKLAQSLGTTGHLAMFGKDGLSYSPLYPLILAPLYRLHLSGLGVYEWSKVINCFLMTLAAIPTYMIARYVLSPGRALVATGLSLLAPLMLYTTLEMSENAAYPLALCAFWAILVAIRSPSWAHDLVVIGCCALATLARLPLVVLLPAAFLAIVLEAAITSHGWRATARRALKGHPLLVIANVGGAVVAIAAIAGTGALSLAGQYSQQRNLPTPPPWELLKLVGDHIAGIDLAVGVVPFAGTLVAAYLWTRARGRAGVSAFASMALSVTAVLVLLVAFTAYGQSHGVGTDLPRIHERYLIYVLPLFIIAMLAPTGIARSRRLLRVGLVAALIAGLLPLVIPFGTLINDTVAADTFGLSPFVAATRAGGIKPSPHAALIIVGYALCLAVVYALARPNTVIVVAVVAAVFVGISISEVALLEDAARGSRHGMPSSRNWVDAAGPRGGVMILENPRRHRLQDLAVAQTAFFNLSVSRLYYGCDRLLMASFGELPASIDARGRFVNGGEPIRARYAVVPRDGGILGRMVAVDRPGHLALVELKDGVLEISPRVRRFWRCPGSA